MELLAAKFMGRWRSGAPLVLAPDKDDPALGSDPRRNNDFNYGKMDPHGYAVPLGSHIRRMRMVYGERSRLMAEVWQRELGDASPLVGTDTGMHAVAMLPRRRRLSV